MQLEEVASTNEEVKRALEAGEPEGLAVRARRQVAGYGRQGRTWASPEGGLYLSLLLRPDVPLAQLPTLSLAAAAAVRRALASLVPPTATEGIKLKWPNDIVVAPCDASEPQPFRKLCGISLETHAGGVCVGIGVNVCPLSESMEIGGKDVAGNLPAADVKNAPIYLADLGFPVKHGVSSAVSEVCSAVLKEFSAVYEQWLRHGFGRLREEYEASLILIGQEVCIADIEGAEFARGAVEGVGRDGRLLLRTSSGNVTAVASGEAHLLPMRAF